MKLMTHTSLFWVTMGMILFFLLGVSFYQVFKELSEDRLEKELVQEMNLILEDPEVFLDFYSRYPGILAHIALDTLEIQTIPNILYHDSLVFDSKEQQYIPVRCIQFTHVTNGQLIRYHICKSTISSDELTERITLLIAAMALLFTLGLFLMNRHVFSQTWRGFYSSLKRIKEFRAGDPVPEFSENEIDEFEDLNTEITRMAERITQDYHNLQSFTSHAAHEFQTPIAVIQSKAEILMQNENLTEPQIAQLNSIIQYARQLSRITQALSLLFRIDNNQYPETEEVVFNTLIADNWEMIQDQCQLLSVQVNKEEIGIFAHRMNPELAQVLVMNLIRNAIRHNHPEGVLELSISEHSLCVRNSGVETPLDTNKIFQEFFKGDSSGGLGLGLAIVQKIAARYQLDIQYSFTDKKHQFVVSK